MRYGANGEGRELPLTKDVDGYFTGHDPHARAGQLYQFWIDRQSLSPDPASRFQPAGIFGPSMIVDPESYSWTAREWTRVSARGRVIYELHVGTFSADGTFAGVMTHLDHLVSLGINTIELMPVHDFPGRWNWGYDGVYLFAPARCYGRPDDLRALVDAAHQKGVAVILDVVYNHLGATGNPLPQFADQYFHESRESGWGRSLNFDGANSPHVRRFFIENACYWLDEFRFDGLRLDATHALEDASERHLLADIADAVHARGAFVIAEDERNDVQLISPAVKGGYGLDAVWADDFHHSVRVAATGERQGYFRSFTGTCAEFVMTLSQGWYYSGQVSPHTARPRGTSPAGAQPEQFVVCISNHDQVGNRPLGDRLNHATSPECYRAVSMLLCLGPYTPMLFMGQEWSASTPFLYFTDHPGELGQKIAWYRTEDFRKSGMHWDGDALARMPDPQAETTFLSSVLRWDEPETVEHRRVLELYRTCLGLRAAHEVFRNPDRASWEIAEIQAEVLGMRWKSNDGDWLLILGLKATTQIYWEAHALLKLRSRHKWVLVLHSNEIRFGGNSDQGNAISLARLDLIGPAAFLLRETPP